MQLRRSEGLAWRKLGDETIIINLRKRMMYGLNSEAGAIWDAMDSGVEIETVLSSGAESVEGFVRDLVAEGLANGPVNLPGRRRPGVSDSGPRVMWKEEVQQFAGGCGFQAGQGGICDNAPLSS